MILKYMYFIITSLKHGSVMYSPLNPTFIWKNWGIIRHYTGVYNFLYFDQRQRFWVLVRTLFLISTAQRN